MHNIIQLTPIINAQERNNDLTVNKHGLIALCDDGTMWRLDLNELTPRWYRLPSIPNI